MAAELGVAPATVFGAFSVSLIVMALAGPPVGRAIDRRGGRGVLAISNAILAVGLVCLGFTQSVFGLYLAWCVLGIGMALGLYDAAFATLVRLHGAAARLPITGITLIAGFASTVGWPVSAYLAQHGGWRLACVAWAAVHLLIALPVNLLLLPKAAPIGGLSEKKHPATEEKLQTAPPMAMPLLIAFAAATSFVTSAMAAHLPGLLVAMGATSVVAVGAAALLGPAQVAARIVEILAARRYRVHPLVPARVATALHPIAGLTLAAFGGAGSAMAYTLLHGAGNGLITIVRGTLPLALFGQAGYGERQGVIAVLARAMQAAAPFSYAWVLYNVSAQAAIALTALLSLAALGALLALRS
jgi:MFS family permease